MITEETVCLAIGIGFAYLVQDPAGLAVGALVYLLAKVFL